MIPPNGGRIQTSVLVTPGSSRIGVVQCHPRKTVAVFKDPPTT